jgi:pyruvate dehydrogenase E2 component (dihydrolipoamide acetyltransferase)
VTEPDERIQPVTMPKWGLSMTSGKIVDWLVDEGDVITPGMDLAEIDTDKIVGTLEATQEGVLRRIVAAKGVDVPVSGVIALVAPADVPAAAIYSLAERALADIEAGIVEEAPGPELRTVEVDGRQLAVASVAGAGAGAVLLVHGYGGDKNSWLFVQEPLAESGPTVHALDLPGHGTSSKNVGDVSLDGLAATVEGVLDALDVADVHLVGHSLGGAVVTAVAARSPDRVRSLTLAAPAGFGRAADAAYLRGFAAASSRRELKPLLGRLFADEGLVTRQMVDDLLRYKRLDGVDGALEAFLGTLLDGDEQALDTASLLAQVQVPVRIVWGAQDQVLPATGAPEPSENVQVRVVDGAGHMVHMEAAAVALEEVREAITSAS